MKVSLSLINLVLLNIANCNDALGDILIDTKSTDTKTDAKTVAKDADDNNYLYLYGGVFILLVIVFIDLFCCVSSKNNEESEPYYLMETKAEKEKKVQAKKKIEEKKEAVEIVPKPSGIASAQPSARSNAEG